MYGIPQVATPHVLAYSIHVRVGHGGSRAKVNNKMVPCTDKLRTGEQVEIITQKEPNPSRDWLKIVKTSEAKSKIRNWFKTGGGEENIEEGRAALGHELRRNLMAIRDGG